MNHDGGLYRRALIVIVCLVIGHAQAQATPSCEGVELDERAMALCQSFFVAYGCGGGLQREELRCRRLGQEFEHQTGIPYRLLPGLAGSTAVFDGNGGQLNLGELLELSVPPDVLNEEVRVSARLTPKSRTESVYGKFAELVGKGRRAVFDIRIQAGPSAPALGRSLKLELDTVPFIASMDGGAREDGYRLFVLSRQDTGEDDALGPLRLEVAPDAEEASGRVVIRLPAESFIKVPSATGPDHEAVISVISP